MIIATKTVFQDSVGGSTTTTIVVLDQTEKHKAKMAPTTAQVKPDVDSKSFFAELKEKSLGKNTLES